MKAWDFGEVLFSRSVGAQVVYAFALKIYRLYTRITLSVKPAYKVWPSPDQASEMQAIGMAFLLLRSGKSWGLISSTKTLDSKSLSQRKKARGSL